jgi:hypothetical protein
MEALLPKFAAILQQFDRGVVDSRRRKALAPRFAPEGD